MVLVKLDHPEPLGIRNVIAEYRTARIMCNLFAEKFELITHIENIVTQNQTDIVIADKIRPDGKRLGNPFRLILNPVFNRQSQIGTVTEQLFNIRRILRR